MLTQKPETVWDCMNYAIALSRAIRADLDLYLSNPAEYQAMWLEDTQTAAQELEDTLETLGRLTKDL